MEEPPKIAYTAFDGSKIYQSSLKLSMQKEKIGNANDLARIAAPKTAQMLYNTMRVGPRLILRSAFELLRANMVTRVISVVVLLAIDKFNLFRGRISVKQFVINVILALMLLVGGTAGWILGSQALSHVVENLILGIIAGIVGAGLLSAALSFAVNKIIHLFVKDDTEDMLDIYNQTFASLAQEHGLNTDEIKAVTDSVCMNRQRIRDIFMQKKNRPAFALSTLAPHVENAVARRGEKNDHENED